MLFKIGTKKVIWANDIRTVGCCDASRAYWLTVLCHHRQVMVRTARLVSQWQCVGFCHGVLNTDNMSILGLTLDYGPYGFLDRYYIYIILDITQSEWWSRAVI